MKNPIIIAVLLSGSILLAGCPASKGSYSGNIEDDTPDTTQDSSPVEVEEITGSVEPGFSPPPTPANDERKADSLLETRVVYFDYDKSLINSDSIPVISAHADFLNSHTDKGIVLSGHADSRGSNEYNLALGQRRADAVRDMMLSLGVTANQLESLSFGEESPAVLGENESAWQKNRRVEFRYTDE